jgi:cardiolipin synthase
VWDLEGEPLPRDEFVPAEQLEPEGNVAMRIVATEPASSGLLRVDGLVAAAARRTLWISDAYFAGIPSYVQALRAAALDGVDVRLLVPGGTDIPVLRPISRAGYRPLLEAGVRVFEWNGPMMHAKTAVADGWWARVGSSNLNIASWIGNWELDALIEDADFARLMEEQYLADLEHATELLLRSRERRRWALGPPGGTERRRAPPRRRHPGSATRAAAGALRVGNTMTAAVANRRVLAPTEARIVGLTALILLVVGVVAVLWPRLLAWPLAAILLWLGTLLLVRAVRLYREQMRRS